MDDFIGKLTDDQTMSCSRLPALLGLSSYSSPNDELQKSIAALEGKPRTGSSAGEAADWGNELENTILTVMAKRLGVPVDTQITERLEHEVLPLQGSLDGVLEGDGRLIEHNPDRGIFVMNANSIVLDGPGVAESKLTSAPASDEPAPYRGPWQVQGLMMCGDTNWSALGILYRGTELRIYLAEADPAMQAKIADEVVDFERRVGLFRSDGVTDWYPPLDTNDAARTYSRGDDDVPPISLTGANSLRIAELIECKRTVKSMNSMITDLTLLIMDEMGSHTAAHAIDENGDQFAEIVWGMSAARREFTTPAKPPKRAKTLKIVEMNRG